jgi:hypothetical protein
MRVGDTVSDTDAICFAYSHGDTDAVIFSMCCDCTRCVIQ